MHRSGTSSVTGALTLAGAQPPATLMPPKPDNPTGFWESERIALEDDLILSRLGAEWFTPGRFDLTPLLTDQALIDHLVAVLDAEFPAPKGPPILKDPRMCRLAPLWFKAAEAWGRPTRVLMPLRPPAEVAASLLRRNGLPLPDGLRLWVDHVVQAERDSRDRPRAIILWPDVLASPAATLHAATARAGIDLAVETSAASLQDFIDPSRRHERLTLDEIDHPAARQAERVYAALADLSLAPESSQRQTRLDVAAASLAP